MICVLYLLVRLGELRGQPAVEQNEAVSVIWVLERGSLASH